ncbi:sigma-70 family RNA polymerase sigma factor [Streptomyces calidiresistens]|uniref:Sigma-70 family RNA polymerase sigma factor n=1 Tax=Streptomyces calidiresistens TaxID=1485586 RepID=A0A7W3T4U0_9ACTN|nr:sigma-70 family RNA polymerase sigma factor [Streptomyces calidiresistens]
MPAAWTAFHEQYYPAYLAYAELQLGDREEAGELVHRVFVHLAAHWQRLMREEAPMASAWALLKSGVARHLEERGRTPAMPETAVFRNVGRRVLEDVRGEFAAMESALGLYTAIARLPERQFDVIVLRYVLGYPTGDVARLMGVSDVTVRTHCTLARRKLGRDLQMDTGGDGDDDDARR